VLVCEDTDQGEENPARKAGFFVFRGMAEFLVMVFDDCEYSGLQSCFNKFKCKAISRMAQFRQIQNISNPFLPGYFFFYR